MSASTHVSARLLTALACVVTVAAIVVPTSTASAPTPSAPQEIVRDSGDANFARSVHAQAASQQTTQESGGFDWGTVGMGAAGAFGLIVLAGGTTLVVRRRSQPTHVQS